MISYDNEGVFTSVTRMRTTMRLPVPPPEYPAACNVELRGAWNYPKTTSSVPLEPDAPVILLRDLHGAALARFKPNTLHEVVEILRNKVFSMDTMAKRLEELRMANEREQALKRKIEDFGARMRVAVPPLIFRCDGHIKALAQAVSDELNRLEVDFVNEDAVAAQSALKLLVPFLRTKLQQRLHDAMWEAHETASV